MKNETSQAVPFKKNIVRRKRKRVKLSLLKNSVKRIIRGVPLLLLKNNMRIFLRGIKLSFLKNRMSRILGEDVPFSFSLLYQGK